MHFLLLEAWWEKLNVASSTVYALLMFHCELHNQWLVLIAEVLKPRWDGIEVSILAGLKTCGTWKYLAQWYSIAVLSFQSVCTLNTFYNMNSKGWIQLILWFGLSIQKKKDRERKIITNSTKRAPKYLKNCTFSIFNGVLNLQITILTSPVWPNSLCSPACCFKPWVHCFKQLI